MEDRTGEVLDGRYRLDKLLGEGGMGQVYVGAHLITGRMVAVKFLLPELANNKEAVQRFYREARAATAIGSDHICEVLDMTPPEAQTHYLVMEYLEGETLKDGVHRLGRMQMADAVNIMLQVLEALYAAHKAGIVHRDIKPENVFLVQREGKPTLVKLLDFGISKMSSQQGEDHSLTRTGTVLGTPYYMSPEQARGDRDVGPHADLYAVGVMLYEVLTGVVPFDAESFSALVVKIVTEVPLHPCQRNPELPRSMGDLIMKAMAREHIHRFANAKEMAEALRAVAMGQAIEIQRIDAAEESFESIPVADASSGVNAFPKTQIQSYDGISGISGQTPLTIERQAEGARPKIWLFVGGGAAIMAFLIVVVGGILIFPYLSEPEVRPPPRPTTSSLMPPDQTKVVTPQIPTLPSQVPQVDAGAAVAKTGGDAGAQAQSQPSKIKVSFAIDPATATVYLDDREIEGGTSAQLEIPADGETHRVKATARGHEEASQEFTATEDTRIALTLVKQRSGSSGRRTSGRDSAHTTTPTKQTKSGGYRPVTGVVTPSGW